MLKILADEIKRLEQAGIVNPDILISAVVPGYICGEESAMIESLRVNGLPSPTLRRAG